MTKIIELRASGFARLTAVSIRPDGALVQIVGKNQQGKTSVLHAIWTALKGRAVAPVQPINKNMEEARIDLDLGTMAITRTFRKDRHGEVTSDLKVVMADGNRRIGAKPQAMIDALLGDLSFDPLAFARLGPKDQFERVRALVPGFDFEANQAERDEAFEQRTEVNRAAKAARAQASGIVLPAGPKPKPVDTKALSDDLLDATRRNQENAARRSQRHLMADDVESKLDEAERLRARAETLEKEAASDRATLDTMPKVADDIDIGEITKQMAAADGTRRAIEMHETRARHEREADEAERLSATLSAFIDTCDREKREAIAKAKMPVEGLGFGDGMVTLNGLAFADAGTAEKIRASVGIGIALNPDLRVMLVDEGSELDSDSLALVAKMAEENDYQIWMARVAEGEAAKAGFEIVDGTVAK